MRTEEIISRENQYILQTYARPEFVIERGNGVYLFDTDGNRFLDFVSGLAVCNLGHCHPKITEAIQEQAQTLLHVSNLFHIQTQTELAKLLVQHSFAEKVFFCNSGAEANEAAIKLARRYWYDKNQAGKNSIISMRQSFHGRTLATLSATGNPKVQHGFEPLVRGFVRTPYEDLE